MVKLNSLPGAMRVSSRRLASSGTSALLFVKAVPFCSKASTRMLSRCSHAFLRLPLQAPRVPKPRLLDDRGLRQGLRHCHALRILPEELRLCQPQLCCGSIRRRVRGDVQQVPGVLQVSVHLLLPLLGSSKASPIHDQRPVACLAAFKASLNKQLDAPEAGALVGARAPSLLLYRKLRPACGTALSASGAAGFCFAAWRRKSRPWKDLRSSSDRARTAHSGNLGALRTTRPVGSSGT